MKKLILFLGCIALLSSCASDYSSGTRTGYLTKFSKKGYFVKTYEGQLNLGGMRSDGDKVVTNTFDFSLDNETHRNEYIQALVDTLDKAMDLGKRVELHYNQEANTDPFGKRGETDYYVDKVKIIYE